MTLKPRIPMRMACALAVACVLSGQQIAKPQSNPRDRQSAIENVKEAEKSFRDGDIGDALSYSQSAIQDDPTYTRAYLWLGASYAKRKQMLLAQNAYEDAVIIAPQSSDGLTAKSWLRKHSTARPTRGPGDAIATQRIERSFFNYRAVVGDWDTIENAAINGRVFSQAGGMFGYSAPDEPQIGKIVFRNVGFDKLESWIGSQDRDQGEQVAVQFRVLGDGKPLYTSPYIGRDDPAIKISIPIRGYSAVTLIVRGPEDVKGPVGALWAIPTFSKRY